MQCREEDLRSLMFGDYMNPDAEPEERMYQEVTSLDEFYNVVALCLEEYNNTHKSRMNLVIFRSARNQSARMGLVFAGNHSVFIADRGTGLHGESKEVGGGREGGGAGQLESAGSESGHHQAIILTRVLFWGLNILGCRMT